MQTETTPMLPLAQAVPTWYSLSINTPITFSYGSACDYLFDQVAFKPDNTEQTTAIKELSCFRNVALIGPFKEENDFRDKLLSENRFVKCYHGIEEKDGQVVNSKEIYYKNILGAQKIWNYTGPLLRGANVVSHVTVNDETSPANGEEYVVYVYDESKRAFMLPSGIEDAAEAVNKAHLNALEILQSSDLGKQLASTAVKEAKEEACLDLEEKEIKHERTLIFGGAQKPILGVAGDLNNAPLQISVVYSAQVTDSQAKKFFQANDIETKNLRPGEIFVKDIRYKRTGLVENAAKEEISHIILVPKSKILNAEINNKTIRRNNENVSIPEVSIKVELDAKTVGLIGGHHLELAQRYFLDKGAQVGSAGLASVSHVPFYMDVKNGNKVLQHKKVENTTLWNKLYNVVTAWLTGKV